jgi:proteic killer suppression protein
LGVYDWALHWQWGLMMEFYNKATQDIFDGLDSKEARKACPKAIWKTARRKLMQLNAAGSFEDLKIQEIV